MYEAWLKLPPGSRWLIWQSFLLGLIESLLCGIYFGLVFVPHYNVFQGKRPNCISMNPTHRAVIYFSHRDRRNGDLGHWKNPLGNKLRIFERQGHVLVYARK